jgi:hypothetical protein
MLGPVALAEMLWRTQCRLNLRIPSLSSSRPVARFVPRAPSTDVLAADFVRAASSLELCVVVTTYNRPAGCCALLRAVAESVRAAGREQQAFVLVLIDAGDADYTPVHELLRQSFCGRFALYESTRRLGKRGFWFTYQTAFRAVQALDPTFSLFLQDDLTFEPSLMREMFARWEAIQDDTKVVLNLLAMHDDETDGRWIEFRRKDLPQARVRLTQWFDLAAFLAHRRFFERLRFEVFPVSARRWRRDPLRSSGVGEQFTRRLFGRANVYQVRETLVYHGEHPSLMNPEARESRALDNRVRLR